MNTKLTSVFDAVKRNPVKVSEAESQDTDRTQPRTTDALQTLLSTTFAAYLAAHAYHWNVVGPQFVQLHDIFGDQYNDLWDALDEIAERIRAKDTLVRLESIRDAVKNSVTRLSDTYDARGMIASMLDHQNACAIACKSLIETAEAEGDQGSADIAIKRIQAHEKAAWMLRSLLK
jgi:starvation-inducible DNA-binding protein